MQETFKIGNIAIKGIDTGASIAGIIQHFDNWFLGPEDGDDVFCHVTLPLFSMIPKVHIDISDIPEVEDVWFDDATRDKWDIDDTSSVYFAFGQLTGLIKIGFSAGMRNRKAQYRSDCSEPLKFFTMPGTRRLESALHRKFKPIKARNNWFFTHPTLISYALGCA